MPIGRQNKLNNSMFKILRSISRSDKKFTFPTRIFIIASLANFILLSTFFLLLKLNYNNTDNQLKQGSVEQYYFNKEYNEGDPLITKVPNLKDMLAGPIINDIDPNFGSFNAPVVIIEFSDFECQYCYRQEAVLKQILEQYNNQVRLIWKDYPASDPDSKSYFAAVAARCAQAQGKFWLYHDLLFANGQNLGNELFIDLANKINLKIDLFQECLADSKTKNLINDNILEAQALDINGVPFIYINDQEIMGQLSLKELSKIIEIELEKVN